MAKIKVLQVNKLYYPAIGGIEKVVQHISESLKDDFSIQVLVCQPKGRKRQEMVNGVPVYRCGSFGTLFSVPMSPAFLWQFRKMAKDQDLVQFHAPFPLGDLACLLSGYRGKVVLYWHSDVVKQKKLMLFYRPLMEAFLKRVDVIILGAQGVLEGSAYLKPYREKCVVIPFAVDPVIEERGRAYLERRRISGEEKQKNGPVKFLFVGRLVYYKGVGVLLKAFQQVRGGFLSIVGTGELQETLQRFVEERGLNDKVCFLGKLDDDALNKAFEDCDVFVLPSVARSEAFGLVQQEAMAYGKPVINTRLKSGVPEVSLDGITGLTVEPGNVSALAEAMQKMIDYPVLRDAYGAAARKRVEENYTTDKVTAKIKELYESLTAAEES